MKNRLIVIGLSGISLVFFLVSLGGCGTAMSLMSATSSESKKANEAAESFIGKDVSELMAVGMPTYSTSAGRSEQYAFRAWIIRKASGEAGVEEPMVILNNQILFVFNCMDGIIRSYEGRTDDPSFFGTWVKSGR